MTTRRQFIFTTLPTAAVLLGSSGMATAQAAKLEESDAIATALGYKHDASKVDAKKYATFAAGRNCGNCQLFQGKAVDAWGVCGAVGGKQVNAKGWCSAWNKKA
ncbi:high-potential iron-sulfur protein [Undibacterium sp. RuTC16W]|uniref:high-potential iron-sulfur protein n=1 Tax=Undibacterium sp. RuTC16W TaxID=3413048 RepID=UPI003BF3C59D